MSQTSKTAVVFTCGHAKPGVDNSRFYYLGKFLYDIKPDYVIDLGDGADMPSLSSYEGGKPRAIVSQNYEKDIDAYNEAQDLLRQPFRLNKRKRPAWFGFEGNHENRIKKAIDYDPRLEGKKYGISFSHLNTNKWFDEYHEYEYGAPKVYNYDGVDYAHFIGSRNSNRAIGGINHARALCMARHRSTTVGHSHFRNVYFDDMEGGKGIIGLVAGCFKGASEHWAGQANHAWWSGVIVKRCISNGVYEPSFVSLETIRREYGP